MRVLQGKKVVEAPAGWRERLEQDGRPAVIDLGAGDGRFVYESARSDPGGYYIAVEPDAASLAEYAYRASRKPARGGIENAAFVVAPLEQLPPELAGLASRLRVNFPWGSLLRGLLEPERGSLTRLRTLMAPGAVLEIVMSYDPDHDTQAFAGPPLAPLDDDYVRSALVPGYEAAGFEVREWRRMTQDEALAVPSTWGRRLLHARPRRVYFLACVPVEGR